MAAAAATRLSTYRLQDTLTRHQGAQQILGPKYLATEYHNFSWKICIQPPLQDMNGPDMSKTIGYAQSFSRGYLRQWPRMRIVVSWARWPTSFSGRSGLAEARRCANKHSTSPTCP